MAVETKTTSARPAIDSRVLGTYGPGTVIEHTTMFDENFEWVRFDAFEDAKPCPSKDLRPLANWASMNGGPCRFDDEACQWVSTN